MTLKMFFAFMLVAPLAAQSSPQLQRSHVVSVTDALQDDPALHAVIAPVRAEIQASFGKVIGESPAGIFRGRPGEENLLGYWLADTFRARAEALLGQPVHFAITNGGGIRANLRPGTVKVESIYEILPFENELVVAELTGAELVKVLKEGIARRGGEPISGVVVEVRREGEKPDVKVTWSDGRPLDPKETVRVATSDYLLASGDTMPTLKLARKAHTTGLSLRQVVMDEVERLGKAGQALQPPKAGRYVIAPELLQALRDKKLEW